MLGDGEGNQIKQWLIWTAIAVPVALVMAYGIAPGGDNFGKITAGGGALTSCVINFGKTWGAAPSCTVSSTTALASLTVTASTTQLTVGGTSLTGGVITYTCGSTASLEPGNDNFADVTFEKTG